MFDSAAGAGPLPPGRRRLLRGLGDRRPRHIAGGPAPSSGGRPPRGLRGDDRGRRLRTGRQPDRRGALLRHHLPPRLRRSRPDRRGVPHRQHVLHPRRTAQPGARPPPSHRGQPPTGREIRPRSRPRSSGSSGPPSASPSGSCSPSASGCSSDGSASTSAPMSSCCALAPWPWRSPSGCSSPSRRPTCRPGAQAGCHRSRRCATTSPSPRAACAGASSSAACSSWPGSPAWPLGLAGVGSEPTYVLGGRHLRRPRRHRAAEPRARPAGAVGTRLALPPRLRHGGPDGRAERPAQPPPDRRDRIRPDDRCRARDDDGRARGVGQGEPRPDPRRGHRRRLRRGECRGAGVLRDDRLRRRGASRGRRGGTGPRGPAPDRRGPGLRLRRRPGRLHERRPTRRRDGLARGPRRRLGRHLDGAARRARGCRSAPPSRSAIAGEEQPLTGRRHVRRGQRPAGRHHPLARGLRRPGRSTDRPHASTSSPSPAPTGPPSAATSTRWSRTCRP